MFELYVSLALLYNEGVGANHINPVIICRECYFKAMGRPGQLRSTVNLNFKY